MPLIFFRSFSGLLNFVSGLFLEQFQEKCATVFRPELRKNKELEHFRVSVKNGNALAAFCRSAGQDT
jgi:hypothetical protein